MPIAEATFQHWSAVARASDGSSSKDLQPSERAVMREVMGFLISADWVIGEAHDLGVSVSAAEVRRSFNRIRREQFPKEREFEVFLEQTKQTVADLLLRVELNILAQRIQRHIVTGHRGARNRKRAMTRFVIRFRRKWTSQTYCLPQYAVRDCGHVQATL